MIKIDFNLKDLINQISNQPAPVCRLCNGQKGFLEPRDMHRSAGWVSCRRCKGKGVIYD